MLAVVFGLAGSLGGGILQINSGLATIELVEVSLVPLLVILGLLTASVSAAEDITIDLGRGPVTVHVPSSYVPGTPTPVVMMLHGYTSSGPETEAILQFRPVAEELGFFYLYPTGTSDLLSPTA